jgi:hypothetical protein
MHKKKKEKTLMKKCQEVTTMLKKVKMKNLGLGVLPLTKKEWMWIFTSLLSLKMMCMGFLKAHKLSQVIEREQRATKTMSLLFMLIKKNKMSKKI